MMALRDHVPMFDAVMVRREAVLDAHIARAARAAGAVGPAVVELSMSSSRRSMRREICVCAGSPRPGNANDDGIAPNPVGSDGQRHRRPSGRCCRGRISSNGSGGRPDGRSKRAAATAPASADSSGGHTEPSGCPTIWPTTAQGTRATWATRAPRPGPDRLSSYLLNQRNVLCLNRNHLFRSIRLRFAHNALPTQRNLPNWLVREQLMEAIKANLLSHQIGSFRQRSRYWSRS